MIKSLEDANWRCNWSLSTAVERWAIDPALFVSVENAESCLPQVFDDALAGRYGRVHEREDMKLLAAVLPTLFKNLLRKMNAVGLDQDVKLPPVVWLRLIREAGVKPVDATLREFERWQDQMRTKDSVILYRRFDDAKRKYVGLVRDREGWGKVRGFTLDEMLTEQRKKTPHWPYCYRWKCFLKKVPGNVDPPVLPTEAVTPVPVLAASEKVTQARANTKPRKRRRRSLAALERAGGPRVMAALKECLPVEFDRKRDGVLEAVGKKDRTAYRCHLSLNELVSLLKQRYGKLLTCSDSTLKSALPHFVKCPRGRPGGMG